MEFACLSEMINRSSATRAFLCLLLLSPVTALGGEGSKDKLQYNWLNPVPREQMREFKTDRPDKTESPITVDAGHYQFEGAVFSFNQDRTEEEKVRSIGVETLHFKAGITHSMNFEVLLGGYGRTITTQATGMQSTKVGFNDLAFRLKTNLFGNDDPERIAAGLIWQVKLPTAIGGLGNDKVEGALMLPVAFPLGMGFELGTMLQLSRATHRITEGFESAQGVDYHSAVAGSAALSRQIFGELHGYVELFGQSTFANRTPSEATFDAGLTLKLSENLQLDAGANWGLTESASDLNPFLGIAARF